MPSWTGFIHFNHKSIAKIRKKPFSICHVIEKDSSLLTFFLLAAMTDSVEGEPVIFNFKFPFTFYYVPLHYLAGPVGFHRLFHILYKQGDDGNGSHLLFVDHTGKHRHQS